MPEGKESNAEFLMRVGKPLEEKERSANPNINPQNLGSFMEWFNKLGGASPMPYIPFEGLSKVGPEALKPGVYKLNDSTGGLTEEESKEFFSALKKTIDTFPWGKKLVYLDVKLYFDKEEK